ncbi:DeoR/GlpR family DNA-binding transcription regulator [Agromyces laixinhei]|uniref:DeoR/GlpR family DNA-binding transcription regulator n=1 Tax=Agromyces laixinhei TaxID=2585717 RepID=UPI0012ED30F2|nr:DeoR/GlpR family DNA-binding transcription regulator [Agromyces laixinhei]
MYADERRRVILAAIEVNGSVSVADLARITQCSEVTIRRDLRSLDRDGLLQRQRGGATAARTPIDEPSYVDKRPVARDEKSTIAAAAAAMVEDGDVIMLCAGTTTERLAIALVRRRILVITNSTRVADVLAEAPEVEVYLLGGVVRGAIHAVVGAEAEVALARMRVDKLFLSGNGLTATRGLSTPNLHVARFDRTAAANADQVIVLADSTKLGADSVAQTVPIAQIDALVTTDEVPATMIDELSAAGVEVCVAETGASRRACPHLATDRPA